MNPASFTDYMSPRGRRALACAHRKDMSTSKSNLEHETDAERMRRLAEEDRSSFLKVVIAAGIAMVVMFIVVLTVLLIAGQKGMPMDHRHQETNTLLQWPSWTADGLALTESLQTRDVLSQV